MHLLKRSLKVLPLALVAASFMAPTSPAMAADPGTATCTFTGLAGNLQPPVRPLPQTGGGGGFDFSGDATCHLTHGATVAPNVSATITASGTYANIACGTGTAEGDANIVFAPNPTGILFGDAHFIIRFASGVGALHITSFLDNLGHRGQGGGEVTIVPAQGSCASGGVSAFTVAGGFAVEGTHPS